MNYSDKINYKKAVTNWAKRGEWNNTFAVTLTFKQAAQRIDGTMAAITRAEAVKTVKLLINRLNSTLIDKSKMRRGAGIKVVTAFEGGAKGGKRLHCHLAIDLPFDVSAVCMTKLVQGAWLKTTWGYNEVTVKKCWDAMGWINYVLKFKSKEQFDLDLAFELWDKI